MLQWTLNFNAAFLIHNHKENQMGDRALPHQSSCAAKRQQLLLKVSCKRQSSKSDWHSTHCQRSQYLAATAFVSFCQVDIELPGILHVKM